MDAWIDRFLNLVLDRSTEELLGAIVLALILSATAAMIGRWICRSSQDQTARMTGVILLVSIASMLVAGTYVRALEEPYQASDTVPVAHMPMVTFPPGFFQMVTVLDTNGNGIVEPKELRDAAETLGTIDRAFSDPIHVARTQGQQRFVPPPFAPPPFSARNLHDKPESDGDDSPTP